ncbi:MAG: hypothetical protein U0531_12270 [Dehalococcoidia bacterium]
MSDAARMRILELLEQGKITAAEAADLLSALDAAPKEQVRRERYRWRQEEPRGDRPRWFRIRVTDVRDGRTRANVTIPIGVVGFGLGFARKFNLPHGAPLDDLREAVRSGRRGTVFDVSSPESGERVEIIME